MNARAALAALAMTLGLGLAAPAHAQHGQDPKPAVQTTNPSARNPTADSVTEDALLRQLQGGSHIGGRISIPDYKASILEQPQGRDYRQFREGYLPWIGGIAVLGMILALAAFFFTKGRIRLEHSEESGRKILRFNAFERFTHWLTAMCFIVLAISGLNYIFGKRLLLPLIGADAFSAWAQYAKFAHNYLSWPFMIGLVVMILVWIRDNIPDRTDINWIKQGGGLVGKGGHPPARRFNAGQKMVYWSVALGGLALAASGLVMLFPFSAADINGMQLAQYVHATVGVLLIAVMIAHIYIGSLGMEGAYDAMGSGEVDLAWAKTHHSLWVEEQQAKTASGPQIGRGGKSPAPAE
ncbi:formate dehydrogenase subunit gamma [Salinarimonas soli]|uniref:Formate dehydrogenase subunit gamma n=2 Tax=Salinarimonas soli TaxID=1638099 RepID=A0A5B2VGE6_9HYPH|nr:formate dehydrogenase subunit gamma [Salinarimonas soli]